MLMAYELDRRGFEVTLIDENPRAGGLIRTERNEYGLVESAAHSLIATDEVRRLCKDLGVELIKVRRGARARFVLRRGKMRSFPLSPWESIRALFRAYFVLSSPECSSAQATMEKWTRRHLGEAVLNYAVSPFLTGIYAARPSEIAVGAAFPSLEIPEGHSLFSSILRRIRRAVLKQDQARPKARHRKAMMAPKEGMGALTEALEKRLEERLGTRFRRGEEITRLPQPPNLILAVPADRAAVLLKDEDPSLANALSQVRYSPLVSATVFIPRKVFKYVPRGVGVLIPESENRRCLGVLFNSSAFEGRVTDESRWVSLTMMLGGSLRPEIAIKADSEIESIVREELAALFKLQPSALDEVRVFITRWSRAIPRYSGQLMQVWSLAQRGWCTKEGRILFGNYTGQVSLRGMIRVVDALGSNLAAGLHV